MYQIKIGNHTYNLEQKEDQVFLNDNLFDVDLSTISDSRFHAIRNNKSYNIEIIELNKLDKTALVKVNSNIYTLKIKDQYDELLEKMGLNSLNISSVKDIKAPMPGMVIKILVKENDMVKKGDALLVLEAMKMENLLKSPIDTQIKSVKIKTGDKVEKNEVLLELF
jgi:biotin carboxyl carrier protein